MISESYNIKEFIEEMRGKDYLEIVYLANQEATEAERFSNQCRKKDEAMGKVSMEYATVLKDIIFFLRHGIKTSSISRQLDFDMLHSLQKNLRPRDKVRTAC